MYKSVIPAIAKWEQEDQFKAILSYIASLWPPWDTKVSVLKEKKIKKTPNSFPFVSAW